MRKANGEEASVLCFNAAEFIVWMFSFTYFYIFVVNTQQKKYEITAHKYDVCHYQL